MNATTNSLSHNSGIDMERVSFPNATVPRSTITIAGHLFLPAGFDARKTYPAILVGHPAGGVKEQTAGLYARKLAELGYITLAFDASYQGESGGEPHSLEDPAVRVEDFRAATDYLSNHSSVDANRIGVLGICAGGGYGINAAQTDTRLRAVATISMVDLGQLRRDGLGGMLTPQLQKRMEEATLQRTKEAQGEPIAYVEYSSGAGQVPANIPTMYREIADYYGTSRGYHPNEATKYPLACLTKLFNFTALDHVELISPRPLLLIAGRIADSHYFSDQAYERAKEPKELFDIDGATHVDLYDKPHYIQPAVEKLKEFYGKNL
jgi:fermentation-respiration switch protein FrsA (DUF1100 family)